MHADVRRADLPLRAWRGEDDALRRKVGNQRFRSIDPRRIEAGCDARGTSRGQRRGQLPRLGVVAQGVREQRRLVAPELRVRCARHRQQRKRARGERVAELENVGRLQFEIDGRVVSALD